MATINNTPRVGTNLNIGTQAMSLTKFAATLALGIAGTLFFQGNLTTTREYNTVMNVRTVTAQVYSQTGSTATGGLKSGGAQGNYQAITVKSPFNATDAASNGVNTGTGVLNYTQLEIIAASAANSTITCSIANQTVRGTGGTIVIPRTVMSTGAIVLRSTGSFIIGPTETFRCSIGHSPTSALNVKTLQEWKGTRLTN